MAERLLLVVAVGAVIMATWALLRLRQARRLRALAGERLFQGLLPAGQPAVVSFTLRSCVECRTRQAPALDQLRAERRSAVTIVSLPADAHAEITERLGILTVPSTAVLDAGGQVRFLNQGYADAQRLAAQLDAL
jgi:hypothetical protein